MIDRVSRKSQVTIRSTLRIISRLRPSPAVSRSATPLEERRERIHVEEGRSASSRRCASAAASTRIVGSRARNIRGEGGGEAAAGGGEEDGGGVRDFGRGRR
jgi:hypothetical protein